MRPSLRKRNQTSLTRYVRLGALWAVILTACGGLATAALIAMRQPPDPVTLCRSGRAYVASILVLIDTTDSLTEIHRRRLSATISAAEDHLPRGGKLTVLAVNSEDAGQPRELVSLCNPGTASDADPLFSTVSRIDEAWNSEFAKPITEAVTRAFVGEAAASSPIIRTIAAAITRPDFDARVANRRLIIVSDMVENQPGVYSQLQGGDFWTAYQRAAKSSADHPDLRGIGVTIDYLTREKYAALQGSRHRLFWQRFFEAAGATGTAFIGLQAEAPSEPVVQVAEDETPRKTPVIHKRKRRKK